VRRGHPAPRAASPPSAERPGPGAERPAAGQAPASPLPTGTPNLPTGTPYSSTGTPYLPTGTPYLPTGTAKPPPRTPRARAVYQVPHRPDRSNDRSEGSRQVVTGTARRTRPRGPSRRLSPDTGRRAPRTRRARGDVHHPAVPRGYPRASAQALVACSAGGDPGRRHHSPVPPADLPEGWDQRKRRIRPADRTPAEPARREGHPHWGVPLTHAGTLVRTPLAGVVARSRPYASNHQPKAPKEPWK
jgi:hypothetical protein